MKVAELKPSKYLKALVDIAKGQTLVATISDFSQETGSGDEGDFTINLLHFQGNTKTLKLNVGMLRTLEDLYGGETEDWAGKRVELYCMRQPYNGKTYDVIRISDKAPK